MERFCCGDAPIDEHPEADLVGVGHAVIEVVERPPFVEVGGVHGVPGSSQLIGELVEPRCLSLCVMEQQYFGHVQHLLPVGHLREAGGILVAIDPIF